MTPLEFYSSMQWRNAEGSERRGPVRDRKPCVVAGNESSGNDQNKGRASGKDGEGMVCAIIRCGEGLQIGLHILSVAPASSRASSIRRDGGATRARTGETPVLTRF